MPHGLLRKGGTLAQGVVVPTYGDHHQQQLTPPWNSCAVSAEATRRRGQPVHCTSVDDVEMAEESISGRDLHLHLHLHHSSHHHIWENNQHKPLVYIFCHPSLVTGLVAFEIPNLWDMERSLCGV
jgi:hypothetical protein